MISAMANGAADANEIPDSVETEEADTLEENIRAVTVAMQSKNPRRMKPTPPFGIDEFSYDMTGEWRCFWRNRSMRLKTSSRTSISAR